MRYRLLGLVLLATIAVASVYAMYSVRTDASETAMPRMADGHPDLNGYWYRRLPPLTPVRKEGASIILDPDGPRENLPPSGNDDELLPGFPKYKPEYLAKVKELSDNQVKFDTALQCQPPGVPRIGPPQKIVQTAREMVFLYDDLNGPFFRVIPIDGQTHRPATEWRSYLGDAVGKWEDDTLVVETINFNDETWLIDNGAFHTLDLRVVERLRRTGDKLEYRVTSHDPAVLAEPWEGRLRTLQMTDREIDEPLRCEDRDLEHVVNGAHHDNVR